jgi:hypothetical protein
MRALSAEHGIETPIQLRGTCSGGVGAIDAGREKGLIQP